MSEIFSILFAAFILVALFKLFFDDLEDLRTNVKHLCWWLTFSLILDLEPVATSRTGLRFFFWLAIGAGSGFLLYYNLSK